MQFLCIQKIFHLTVTMYFARKSTGSIAEPTLKQSTCTIQARVSKAKKKKITEFCNSEFIKIKTLV